MSSPARARSAERMSVVDAADELQRLDDDLAAGRVDATSYRLRRDELVARRREEEAGARVTGDSRPPVGAGSAAPAPLGPPTPPPSDPPAGTGSVPAVPPSPPARTAGPYPFPPPFRWGDRRPHPDPAADVTQVVGPDAESTQVVPDRPSGPAAPPPPLPSRPGSPPPPGFRPPSFPAPPERTQVVPGGLAGRRPSPPVPASRTVPPWVERGPDRVDRPPSELQGAEVFLGKRRELASVIGTAAVVVVVVLILVLSFTLG